MHKSSLLVFSLLVSSSVCLVGMKRDDRPYLYTPPSVLGCREVSQPQPLGDSPESMRRIKEKKSETLELIAKIRDGYQLPAIVKSAEIRKAKISGLSEALEKAITDQIRRD